MTQSIQPLHGHDLLVLFIQLALLLAAARLGAELMRRMHQPAVIGELLAGVILGPSVLGHYAPGISQIIFPQTPLAFNLLEGMAWVGLVLLLMLTGLEVDIARLRRVGRPAFLVSLFGLCIPFAGGWALGWLLPDFYLTDPQRRALFAAFMATAVAVSAMPVIAKVLMDLSLLRRNIGILILSAAVVDDTVGWVVLSVIAGLAREARFEWAGLFLTLGLLGLFVAASVFLLEPLLRRSFKWVDDHLHGTGVDITLVVVTTFILAAVTERIGVHAVFGAFVAGVLLRQVPRLPSESLHTIEQFVLSVLAPIFFAYVGLRVDLWSLTGWTVPLLILGVAIVTKLLGCEIGGRLGGLGPWERLAAGAAMSVRGAMGLVVALIGLSLGLLTQEIYSIIVGVAVVTSALTPAFLPWIMRQVPLTEEERRRLEAGEVKRVFRKTGAKFLLPTAGGPHAEAAFRVVAPWAAKEGASITVLYVETGPRRVRWLARFRRWFRGPAAPLTPIQEHLERLHAIAQEVGATFDVRRVSAGYPAEAILAEAGRGYDVLLLGAPGHAAALADPTLSRILARTPCHVVIVRASTEPRETRYRHILVPTDGSFFARAALEFAVNVAEASGGRVTAFTVLPESEPELVSTAGPHRRVRDALKGALLGPDLKPITTLAEVPVEVRIARSDRPGEAIILEAMSSDYDLIVLGAENKTLARPLFYGQGTQYVFENASSDVAVVVPRL